MDPRYNFLINFLLEFPTKSLIPYPQKYRLIELVVMEEYPLKFKAAVRIIAYEYGSDAAQKQPCRRFLNNLRKQVKKSYSMYDHRWRQWIPTFQDYAPMRRLWEYCRMECPSPFFRQVHGQSWMAQLFHQMSTGVASLQNDLSYLTQLGQRQRRDILQVLSQVLIAGYEQMEPMQIEDPPS